MNWLVSAPTNFRAFACLALLTLGQALVRADDTHAKSDRDRFMGTWTVDSVEYLGEAVPAKFTEKMVVKGERDRLTFVPSLNKSEGKVFLTDKPSVLVLRFDAGAKPGEVTVETSVDGDASKSWKMLGRYQFDGDTLRICWFHDGKTRPAEFKTRSDNGILFVLKRQRAK